MTRDDDPDPPTPAAPDLDALFREHIDAIRSTLFREGLRGPDVDDVLQKVLLAAFQKIHVFDPASGTLRAWLCGIARNQARSHRRITARCRERHRSDETLLDVADGRPDAEACLIEKASGQELAMLLREIPAERREVVKAFELSGMPLSEVAETLRIPETTVKSRLRRGREDLEAAARRERARRRWCALPLSLLDAWNDPGMGPRTPWRPAHLLGRAGNARWVQHVLAGGMAGSLLVLTPTAPAREAPPSTMAPAAMVRTAAATGAQSAPSGPAHRGPGAKGDHAVTLAATTRSTRALHGTLDGADEGEHDLVQSAAAAISARHWEVARRLLDEHRRRFPSGRHAGERERLLVSLGGGHVRRPAAARPPGEISR